MLKKHRCGNMLSVGLISELWRTFLDLSENWWHNVQYWDTGVLFSRTGQGSGNFCVVPWIAAESKQGWMSKLYICPFQRALGSVWIVINAYFIIWFLCCVPAWIHTSGVNWYKLNTAAFCVLAEILQNFRASKAFVQDDLKTDMCSYTECATYFLTLLD